MSGTSCWDGYNGYVWIVLAVTTWTGGILMWRMHESVDAMMICLHASVTVYGKKPNMTKHPRQPSIPNTMLEVKTILLVPPELRYGHITELISCLTCWIFDPGLYLWKLQNSPWIEQWAISIALRVSKLECFDYFFLGELYVRKLIVIYLRNVSVTFLHCSWHVPSGIWYPLSIFAQPRSSRCFIASRTTWWWTKASSAVLAVFQSVVRPFRSVWRNLGKSSWLELPVFTMVALSAAVVWGFSSSVLNTSQLLRVATSYIYVNTRKCYQHENAHVCLTTEEMV